jgi:hypothetical protein
MSIPTLVTGDDFNLPVALTLNNIAVSLTGATITAGIVSVDHSKALLAGVVQPESNPGSNWASGIAGVAFTKAQTADITSFGMSLVEIQVAGPTTNTWFTPVNVIRGSVT